MRTKLIDRVVAALQPGDKGTCITYDTEVTGFGIRVTSRGSKALVLNCRFGA